MPSGKLIGSPWAWIGFEVEELRKVGREPRGETVAQLRRAGPESEKWSVITPENRSGSAVGQVTRAK
jgi:hypothetical protein